MGEEGWHFKHDQEGLIQTSSDDKEDFVPGEEENSLGNLDESNAGEGSNFGGDDQLSESKKKLKKNKKDKKEKKDKKKKDKKDKKSRHLTRPSESLKEEDLPPMVSER